MAPEDSKVFILLFSAIGLIAIFCARFVKEIIWNIGKRSIKSTKEFYNVYIQAMMAELALLEAVAIFGVVIFFITGILKVSLAFVAVSLVAQAVIFAMGYDSDMENKRAEFPLLKG